MFNPFKNGDEPTTPKPGPLEPTPERRGLFGRAKAILFLLFIIYLLVGYLHEPFLMGMGRFLVVKKGPVRSDLIVCLMGEPVERGLEAADLYHSGLSRRIFLGREVLPDGYDVLTSKGVDYPETYQLLSDMLVALKVPQSALILGKGFVDSTMDEALAVRKIVKERGFRSILIVTSPTHTRRAFMAFRKAFRGMKVKITIVPSSYSGFNPTKWWKRERYAQEVLVEYLKLLYYFVRYR